MIVYMLYADTTRISILSTSRPHLQIIAMETLKRSAREVVWSCRPYDRYAKWIITPAEGWPLFRAQLTRVHRHASV